MTDARLVERHLHSQSAGPGHLLEAVFDRNSQPRSIRLFFDKTIDPATIDPGPRIAVQRLGTIGGAPLLYGQMHGTPESVALTIAGQPVELALHADECDLFKDLRSAVVIRNGESADCAAQWIGWHARHFGLQAVLLVDRAQPGTNTQFIRKLEQRIAPITALKRCVIVTSPRPLGAPDLPPESHPFNVPGAPGKDRMKIPPPDPWRAPLDCGHLFELLRARFLNEAASVVSLELHDLVHPDAANPFEQAEATGVVGLIGRQLYPWKLRDEANPQFSDHICAPFDGKAQINRWAIAPGHTGSNTVWRPNRIVGGPAASPAAILFGRHMAMRHTGESVSQIVPKSSLIEIPDLIDLWDAQGAEPAVRMPEVKIKKRKPGPQRVVIVTCMKNEGPFILEWLAYHRAIGVTDVLVYTNDCDDGTDHFLELLQDKGLLQHRDNPFRETGQKPQHAALAASDNEECVKQADWAISMDVDEFINIKTGDGTLNALFAALPEANMIACTWRLFGNSNIHEYDPAESLLRDYTRCAREFSNKPHQAWGFKTLFQRLGIFKKMGVHRPKGLNPQLWQAINWVNGSGAPLPADMYRNAWRSTSSTYGYDLVQLNHYAVRSAESFLVKRDRGRVNHVDRDQGLAYWFRMNNNGDADHSIKARIPMMETERDKLLADPEIRAAHEACIQAHRDKIAKLKERTDQQAFYATLTSDRMERLSRMHSHFGANVFLGGPQTVPDWVVFGEHPEGFFFTVDAIDEVKH